MNLREALEDLCLNIRNERSSLRPSPVIPNRAAWIMNKLEELEIPYIVDSFLPSTVYRMPPMQDERGMFQYYNIMVSFQAINQEVTESVVFTAHHDINNTASQNCQDNSASVINLLRLCSILKTKQDLQRNVYVVFTDGEEFGGKGAFQLSQRILEGALGEVTYVVNSELTAFGQYVWSEKAPVFSPLREKLIETLEGNLNEKFAPFNDSFIFRNFGIDSICLGILPKDNQGRLQTEHWMICHSINDTIAQANYEHMENYVQFLAKLI